MRLTAVPFQLVFAGMEDLHTTVLSYQPDDLDWTPKNAHRRLLNAARYCEWQASRWSYLRERWSPEKWWYLSGSRSLRLSAENLLVPKRIEPVLPLLHPLPAISPQEAQLIDRPRKWLVDALMHADERYTDRHLLSHLPKKKLAGMMVRALVDSESTERRRA